ncbi:MAG: Gfo/Idh/MocA family protein [Roseicyclus sp.]
MRVAILGAGIGREHLAGYRALPDRFRVVALCDLDRTRAESVAGGDGTIRLETEVAAILAQEDVDLIDVCLPPHLHAAIGIAALEAGKHVICEKPLACSLDDVAAMETAAAASGRMLFPVFQYRYGPAFAALDALVAGGRVGQPVVASLETHWNRGTDYYAVPWRGTWAGEAGGAVLSHAIHAHDLLCRYFGPVAAVQARLATRVNPIETEDCAAIALTFANGAIATSSVTLGAAMDETRLRFVFRDLTATSARLPYAPGTGTWRFTARQAERQAEVDAIVAAHADAKAGFEGFLIAVSDALSGREAPAPGLADGRASIELVTAIYAAARSGGTETLPCAASHPLWRGWKPEVPA